MTISLRINDQEASLIKQYADMKSMTVSDLIRLAVLERIEDEIDLDAYQRAHAAFDEDPTTYTLDEVEKELGL